MKKHIGSCHCGAVKFEAELDLSKGAGHCNCSICTKLGGMRTFCKPAQFTLRTDRSALGMYEWGYKIAKRFFCSTCGIHVFGEGHLEELGGDYVSINVLCLDDIDPSEVTVRYWDGRHDNWHAGMRSTPWPIRPIDPPAS